LSLGGELSKLIEIDTLGEQNGIERDSAVRIPTISSTVGFIKKLSEELIVGVWLVGMAGGTETETFLNGGGQQGRIMLGRVSRGKQRKRLGC
jgi:hypothetical protein